MSRMSGECFSSSTAPGKDFAGAPQNMEMGLLLTGRWNYAGTSGSTAPVAQVRTALRFSGVAGRRGQLDRRGGPSGRQVFGGNGELIYEDSDENTKLTDCYYEKKDWRLCKDEVSLVVVVLEKGLKMR